MSKFIVCHMQKFKASDVKGMQIHNQREKESHTNSDIDKSKSEFNYDLIHGKEKVDYRDLVNNRIAEGVVSNRAIRKDAVVCCSFMISSSHEYMMSLPPSEQRRFFQDSFDFLKERYGEKNFVYASVHFDEKTPHMHVGMVPVNEKQKLSAFSFFKHKSELQNLQDKIFEHVKSKGFDVERGISSNRKHLTTQKFKAKTLKEEVGLLKNEKEKLSEDTKSLEKIAKNMENHLNNLEKSLDKVKKVDEVEIKKKGGLIRPKTVELATEDWEGIKSLAKASEGFRIKSEQSEKHLKKEVEKNNRLLDKNNTFKKENDRLRDENLELKKESKDLKHHLQQINEFMRLTVPNYIDRMKTWVKEKQLHHKNRKKQDDSELELEQ